MGLSSLLRPTPIWFFPPDGGQNPLLLYPLSRNFLLQNIVSLPTEMRRSLPSSLLPFSSLSRAFTFHCHVGAMRRKLAPPILVCSPRLPQINRSESRPSLSTFASTHGPIDTSDSLTFSCKGWPPTFPSHQKDRMKGLSPCGPMERFSGSSPLAPTLGH